MNEQTLWSALQRKIFSGKRAVAGSEGITGGQGEKQEGPFPFTGLETGAPGEGLGIQGIEETFPRQCAVAERMKPGSLHHQLSDAGQVS